MYMLIWEVDTSLQIVTKLTYINNVVGCYDNGLIHHTYVLEYLERSYLTMARQFEGHGLDSVQTKRIMAHRSNIYRSFCVKAFNT